MICAKACKNPTFRDQTVTFSGNAPALTHGPAKRLSVHQPASLMSALPGVTGQSLYDVLCDRVRFTESVLPLGEDLGEGVASTLNSYVHNAGRRGPARWRVSETSPVERPAPCPDSASTTAEGPKPIPRWDAQMVGVKRRSRGILQVRMRGIHRRNPVEHHRHLSVHPTLALVSTAHNYNRSWVKGKLGIKL